MRAIAIDAYGGRERLQLIDLPVPEIGPHDVLIRVWAAGVNPADISFREGRYAQTIHLSFPAIMGSDFAGTVAQVYGLAWGGGSYAEDLRIPAAGEFADGGHDRPGGTGHRCARERRCALNRGKRRWYRQFRDPDGSAAGCPRHRHGQDRRPGVPPQPGRC
jgi:hypothetical protein